MADEKTGPQDSPSSASEALAQVQRQLFQAAYMGNLAGVRESVEKGAKVNAWHDRTGLTALHLAVGTNNLALVKYLLEIAGADLVPDKSGRWPTVIAAECCVSEELCDYIVEEEAKRLHS